MEYALDGVTYEIDLSHEHAEGLREVFAPYLAAARRTGGRRGASSSRGRQTASPSAGSTTPKRSREENKRIREWAKKQGLEVSERGRIPNDIAEQYDARQLSKTPG